MHDALSYPPVWYLMRATGIVSLLLLTLVVALGVATERRAKLAGHRAVTHGIHRSASLLAVAFLAVHVLTAVIDPDAAVGLFSLLVPFAGLGAPVLGRPRRARASSSSRRSSSRACCAAT